MRVLARSGISQLRDLDEVAAIYDSFKDPRARAAIRHVVRAVVDWKGQIVTMADRAYLTEAMPMCVVWGADDLVIPVSHASHAARLAPGQSVHLPDAPYLHLFVPRGRVELEGAGPLAEGDAVRFTATGGQRITASEPAEVLVWEMHAGLAA